MRHNSLHQLTSELVDTYGTIVIERLNIAGLIRNRRLARRLADASLGTIHRQLAYKTVWAGSALGSSSMKREAGTKFMGLDKTGTADWQRPAT